MKNPLPAVFLVRDGILNEYVFDEDRQRLVSPARPDLLCLCRRAGSFLHDLNAMGYLCLAIAHEETSAGAVSPIRRDRIHRRLRAELEGQAAHLHGVYSCFFSSPEGSRALAETDVILEAASTHRVEMHRSFLVAHDIEDVIAGRSAGLVTIWVTDSPGRAAEACAGSPEGRPDCLVTSLDEALEVIREDTRVGVKPHF